MVAQEFIDLNFPKRPILNWCSLARSSYYLSIPIVIDQGIPMQLAHLWIT